MSKLWILLLLAVFVCLLLDCEAQDSTRRRNRNRNRDSGDVEFNAGAGGRGNRRGNAGGRRRPSAGGAGRGRGQRGRGQGGRGQGGRGSGRGRARGGSMLTEATRPFALSLYKELASTEPNVVVSTYSILTALSMVSLGAQRQTEDELRTVMGVSGMRPRKAHKAFHTLAQALASSASGNVTLSQANALFARQGLRIRNGFNRKLRKFYNAEMQNFDMSNPEGPEKPINDWVAMKTNDMIQDFLPPRTITPMTLIWILNAIYFKGLWKKPFESRFTRQQPFYISNSDQASVDMMYMQDDFALGHSSELQARVLEVPYGGDSVSMFILLPEEIEGLAFLESNLTPERLEQALAGLNSQKVQLSLPKMKVEFEADLKEPLQRLGIRRMFDRSQAELGGMLAGRTQQVYVSDGKHKAVLEVTEEGTAAAAATGFGISLMSAPTQPLQFNANHPFMFVVRDKVNNVNLFVGKYSDPRRAM